MANHTLIQKLLSATLICILLVSITPVAFLHNVIANHHDAVATHHYTHDTELSTAGFNCHCEGFVADKNYLVSISPSPVKLPVPISGFSEKTLPNFYSQHHFYAELRGPPAIA